MDKSCSTLRHLLFECRGNNPLEVINAVFSFLVIPNLAAVPIGNTFSNFCIYSILCVVFFFLIGFFLAVLLFTRFVCLFTCAFIWLLTTTFHDFKIYAIILISADTNLMKLVQNWEVFFIKLYFFISFTFVLNYSTFLTRLKSILPNILDSKQYKNRRSQQEKIKKFEK